MATVETLSRGRSHTGPHLVYGANRTAALDDRWVPERPVLRTLPPPLNPEPALGGSWPLLDFLELGALPGAVPCSRLHTRLLLWEWRLTALAEAAELAVSELMTNAIAASHSAGKVLPVRLWLQADRTRLLITVWDSNEYPPLRSASSEDDENGRGLMLVEAVCARWDWFLTAQLTGKAVWALCGA